jgi:PAS domain S-box-containing protein
MVGGDGAARARLLAASVAGGAALVLGGWAFGLPALRSLVPGSVPMQPWAAVALLLGAGALWAAAARAGRIGAALALGMGGVAGLAVAGHAAGRDLGLDALLFREAVLAARVEGVPQAGRMALGAALSAVPLSLALLLHAARPGGALAGQVAAPLALLGAVLPVLTVLGAIAGVDPLAPIPFGGRMALPTALLLLLLALGVLALGRARERAPRLSALLLGLVLATLLPAVAVGFGAVWQAAEGRRQAAQEGARSTVRGLALALDAEIRAQLRTLELLAGNPVLDAGAGADPAEVHALLLRARGVLGSPVALLSPDGDILCHSELAADAPHRPVRQQAALRRAVETGAPVVVNLGETATAAFAAGLILPVLREGRVVAALGLRLEPELFRRTLTAQRIEPGSFAALTDAAQRVVARSDALHAELLGRPIPEGRAALLSAPEGLYRAVALDGTERVFAFRGLDAAPGWTVALGQPAGALAAAAREPVATVLRGGAAALVLGALLALLAAWRILRPLRRLEAHARLVAAGQEDRAGLAPAPVAELETLRAGFAAAEAALRARAAELAGSEERFRLAAFASHGIVYDFDPESNHAIRLGAVEEILGWRPEEIPPTREGWLALVHPEDVAAYRTAAQTVFRGSADRFEVEYRVRRRDGRVAHLWHRARATRDAAGRVRRVIGHILDVTARREAEVALAEKEERLRLAQEAGGIGIHDFDIQRNRIFWDARVRELWGVAPEVEITYGTFAAGLHGDDLARIEASVARALDPGGDGTYADEYRVVNRRDGRTRRVAVTGRATFERGVAVRLVGTVRDVTAEREAEEALRLHREELERLVEDRTAALLRAAEEQRRAEEAMRQGEQLAALGRLTGGVAHDFNNLLQVVTSGAALLRRDLPEARRARVLDALADAGLKARDLTSRLLAFARRQALRPEPFDLNRRIEGMTELLRRTIGSRVRIEAELAEGLPPVMADPGQLEIAVINLATNARDAMPRGGRLTLRTRLAVLEATEALAGGAYVCLDVEDTGEGMTPAVQARIFEPFFTTKEAGKGTGLGLAQVFGFARQSGGDVAVESQPGQGTRFTLQLPRATAPVPEAPSRPEPMLEAMRDASGRVVLVVEDNREAGDFAAALLEELGFRALRAGTVAEALDVLAGGERVDAVFSDVMMPGGQTGLDLALRLRAERPGVAVVLTSGYSARLAEGGAPEGVEVLGKPYRLDELAGALARAFSRLPERMGAAG